MSHLPQNSESGKHLIKKCGCSANELTERLHSVSSPGMGQKFLDIKEITKSDDVHATLAILYNSKDAFAQNMKYHRSCLRKETRMSETADNSPSEGEKSAGLFVTSK